MSNVQTKVFSHTHYGVSTIAAVLYAIAWLLGNQVHAETEIAAVLPATIVSAPRIVSSVATLDPIIVTSQRPDLQTRYATLAPVIVQGSRNVANEETSSVQPLAIGASGAIAGAESATRARSILAKLWSWGVRALL